MRTPPRRALVDGVLAVAVLAVAVAAGVVVDARPRPDAAAAGAVGTLVLEAVLLRYSERVRRLWRRRHVKVLALLAGIALAGAAALLAPTVGPSAIVGGAVTYLALLVVSVER